MKIRLICTDRDTHPGRELVLLDDRGDDSELLAALMSADLTGEEATQVYDWDRISYVSRKSRRGDTVQNKVEMGSEEDELGPLWRFRCPTCRRDWVFRSNRMRQLVDGVLVAGRVSVDLSYLPANLG